MIRKLMLFFISGVMVMNCFADSVNDFEWGWDKENNGYILNMYIGKSNKVIIPKEYDGEKVVGIGESAFANNQLKNIEIPNSVITIGKDAFSGNQLTSLKIPNSVIKIGEVAFARNQLTNIEIPNSVTEISGSAFFENKIIKIIGQKGSTAEEYADSKKIRFIEIKE